MEKVQKAALSKEGRMGRTQTFDWENDWTGGVGGLGVEEENMTRPKMRLKRAKGGCMTGENHDTPKMTARRCVI